MINDLSVIVDYYGVAVITDVMILNVVPEPFNPDIQENDAFL